MAFAEGEQMYRLIPASAHVRGFWGRSCAAMRWRRRLLRWVEKFFFLYLAISCSKEMLWRKVFNFKQSSIRFVLGPPGTMAWVYHFSLREACENKYDFVLRFFASHVHPSKKTLAQTSRLRNVLRYLAAWDNQNAKNDINVALLDLSVLDLNNSKPLNGCCFGRLWCKSRCVFWRWTMAISGVSRSNSIRIRSKCQGGVDIWVS